MMRRKLKNIVKNYTPTEILVREATSNDNWGPSNTLLSKIADISHDESRMMQVMPIIWKRLKDVGKDWRHVSKSLILVEFLILRGNPSITDHCKQHIHFINSLENFEYIEKNHDDVGLRIRRRVASILQLLRDEEHLKNERKLAISMDIKFSRDVVAQGSNVPVKYGSCIGTMSQGPSIGSFSGSNDKMSMRASNSTNQLPNLTTMMRHSVTTNSLNTPGNPLDLSKITPPSNQVEADLQLEIALAESKLEAENNQLKREIERLRSKSMRTGHSLSSLSEVAKVDKPMMPKSQKASIEFPTTWEELENDDVSNTKKYYPQSESTRQKINLQKLPEESVSNCWLDPWSVPEKTEQIPSFTKEPLDPWTNSNTSTDVQPQLQNSSTFPETTMDMAMFKRSHTISATGGGGIKQDRFISNFLDSHPHLVDLNNLISGDNRFIPTQFQPHSNSDTSSNTNQSPFSTQLPNQTPTNPFIPSSPSPPAPMYQPPFNQLMHSDSFVVNRINTPNNIGNSITNNHHNPFINSVPCQMSINEFSYGNQIPPEMFDSTANSTKNNQSYNPFL